MILCNFLHSFNKTKTTKTLLISVIIDDPLVFQVGLCNYEALALQDSYSWIVPLCTMPALISRMNSSRTPRTDTKISHITYNSLTCFGVKGHKITDMNTCKRKMTSRRQLTVWSRLQNYVPHVCVKGLRTKDRISHNGLHSVQWGFTIQCMFSTAVLLKICQFNVMCKLH